MTVSASVVVAAITFVTSLLVGCSTAPATTTEKDELLRKAQMENQLDFGANASAIIAKTGAAKNARFVDGVAVFVRPTAGAMAEATIGGQRVTYVPK